MGNVWPLQDAKSRLSELLRAAQDKPQTITLRGSEAAVVLSAEEYRRLKGEHPKSLLDALRACPHEFEVPPRSKDRGRKFDL